MVRFLPGTTRGSLGTNLLSASTSLIAVQGCNRIGDMTRGSAVKALGEVALRVNNLERMKRFYQEVLGFEVLGEFPNAALLKIAAGYAGHTQVLGLFDRLVSVDKERTTIDHITFTIGLLDYDSERKRLETLGLNVEVYAHEWIDWRSLYFHDPEGNRVEQGPPHNQRGTK